MQSVMRWGSVLISRAAAAGAALALGLAVSPSHAGLPVALTIEDFFLTGTQPDPSGATFEPIQSAFSSCQFCHGDFDQSFPPIDNDTEPFRGWAGSMMAQAMRDPVFHAALTIANQDSGAAGEMCLRCHTPAGWLAGDSTPPDGSALDPFSVDYEGITCHFCHRLVNPTYVPGESPEEDVAVLEALDMEGLIPAEPGSGRYVVDPADTRRGPFDPSVLVNPDVHFGIPIIQSPFHRQSELCATCHEVSNPLFTRQRNGTYVLNAPDAPHPTQSQYDMFPLERTYSEWLNSQFAKGGVEFPDGRFGGDMVGPVESCQHCHMSYTEGNGCRVPGFGTHPDMPRHHLNGGNTWVLRAVDHLNFPAQTGLSPEIVEEAQGRVEEILQLASDMELTQNGSSLNVRITNWSGHKLPSGYPEGRRMWINVKFYDDSDALIAERGAYDFETADLTTSDTKVYECKIGLDATMATFTGLPEGESFHFAFNNTVIKDNRIPPIGFTNTAFEAVQAGHVAYSYPDGQHWDDTTYPIPAAAAKAVVTLYYQTTSKEYIEFLRDENTTNGDGQLAYDMWEMFGKSAPVDMDMAEIDLNTIVIGDLNNTGTVNANDLAILLGAWSIPPGTPGCGGQQPCAADLNNTGTVNAADLAILLGNWTLP